MTPPGRAGLDGGHQGGRVGVVPPPDAVLDLLGRVRLHEHLAEEEPEEVVVAAPEPVGPVERAPTPRGGRAPRSKPPCSRSVGGPPEAGGGPDGEEPGDPLGVAGRDHDGPHGAHRQADEGGPLGVGGVHHRDDVVGVLVVDVGRRRRWGGPTGRCPDRRGSRRGSGGPGTAPGPSRSASARSTTSAGAARWGRCPRRGPRRRS